MVLTFTALFCLIGVTSAVPIACPTAPELASTATRTISSPGSYTLDGCPPGPTGAVVLVIQSDQVDIAVRGVNIQVLEIRDASLPDLTVRVEQSRFGCVLLQNITRGATQLSLTVASSTAVFSELRTRLQLCALAVEDSTLVGATIRMEAIDHEIANSTSPLYRIGADNSTFEDTTIEVADAEFVSRGTSHERMYAIGLFNVSATRINVTHRNFTMDVEITADYLPYPGASLLAGLLTMRNTNIEEGTFAFVGGKGLLIAADVPSGGAKAIGSHGRGFLLNRTRIRIDSVPHLRLTAGQSNYARFVSLEDELNVPDLCVSVQNSSMLLDSAEGNTNFIRFMLFLTAQAQRSLAIDFVDSSLRFENSSSHYLIGFSSSRKSHLEGVRVSFLRSRLFSTGVYRSGGSLPLPFVLQDSTHTWEDTEFLFVDSELTINTEQSWYSAVELPGTLYRLNVTIVNSQLHLQSPGSSRSRASIPFIRFFQNKEVENFTFTFANSSLTSNISEAQLVNAYHVASQRCDNYRFDITSSTFEACNTTCITELVHLRGHSNLRFTNVSVNFDSVTMSGHDLHPIDSLNFVVDGFVTSFVDSHFANSDYISVFEANTFSGSQIDVLARNVTVVSGTSSSSSATHFFEINADDSPELEDINITIVDCHATLRRDFLFIQQRSRGVFGSKRGANILLKNNVYRLLEPSTSTVYALDFDSAYLASFANLSLVVQGLDMYAENHQRYGDTVGLFRVYTVADAAVSISNISMEVISGDARQSYDKIRVVNVHDLKRSTLIVEDIRMEANITKKIEVVYLSTVMEGSNVSITNLDLGHVNVTDSASLGVLSVVYDSNVSISNVQLEAELHHTSTEMTMVAFTMNWIRNAALLIEDFSIASGGNVTMFTFERWIDRPSIQISRLNLSTAGHSVAWMRQNDKSAQLRDSELTFEAIQVSAPNALDALLLELFNDPWTIFLPSVDGLAINFVNFTFDAPLATFRGIHRLSGGPEDAQPTEIRSSRIKLIDTKIDVAGSPGAVLEAGDKLELVDSALSLSNAIIVFHGNHSEAVAVRIGTNSTLQNANISLQTTTVAAAMNSARVAVLESLPEHTLRGSNFLDVQHISVHAPGSHGSFAFVNLSSPHLEDRYSSSIVLTVANDKINCSASTTTTGLFVGISGVSSVAADIRNVTVDVGGGFLVFSPPSSSYANWGVDLANITANLAISGGGNVLAIEGNATVNASELTITAALDPGEPLFVFDAVSTLRLANSVIEVVEGAPPVFDLRRSEVNGSFPSIDPQAVALAVENVTVHGMRAMLDWIPTASRWPAAEYPAITLSCVIADGRRVNGASFSGAGFGGRVDMSPLSLVEQAVACPVSQTATVSRTSTMSHPTSRSSSFTGSSSPTSSIATTATVSAELSASNSASFTTTSTQEVSRSDTMTMTETATAAAPNTLTASESLSDETSLSRSETISYRKPVPVCGDSAQLTVRPLTSPDDDINEPDDGTKSEVEVSWDELLGGIQLLVSAVGSMNATFAPTVADQRVKIRCVGTVPDSALKSTTANDRRVCSEGLGAALEAARLLVTPVHPTAVRVSLPPLPDLAQPADAVEVTVTVEPEGWACRYPPPPGHFIVAAEISDDLKLQAAAVQAIAASSVAAAVVASPAALFDAQSLAAFGLISCANSRGRYAMKSASLLLSPFALGEPPEGFIVTNFVLVLAITGVFAVLIAYRYVRYTLWRGKHDLFHAFYVMRCPSLFFRFTMMLQPGISILSMRLMFDGRWSAASVAGSAFGVLLPFVIHRVCAPRGRPRFYPGPRDLTFFRYEHALLTERWPSWVQRFVAPLVVPLGRYGPAPNRRVFGGPLQNILPTWTVYITVPLGQQVLVAVVASVQSDTKLGCAFQYGVLFGAFLILAVGVAVQRPFRAIAFNVFQALSYLMLAVIVGATGMAALRPGEQWAAQVKSIGILIQLGLTNVRLVHSTWLTLCERCFWKPFAKDRVWNAMRDDKAGTTSSSAFKLMFEQEEELQRVLL